MWRRRLAKLRNFFRHDQVEAELAREIASHLTLLADDFERRGMTPAAARLAAKRAYGGIEQVKELHREERSVLWLEQTVQDLRHACRSLARSPGFTFVAIVTLTLGIGVNATLFSAYNAVALKPLPVTDPNKVVRLERWFEHGYKGDFQYAFSFPEYVYCRDHNDVFSSLIAASWPRASLAEAASDEPLSNAKVQVQLVSANYFTGLGIRPLLGRTFLVEEDRTPGANPLIVISYPFWQRRFRANPHVTGQILKLNGVAFTIIGVAPQEFTGSSTIPLVPDIWAPLSMQAALAPGRDWLHTPNDMEFQILARLKSSATFGHAQAQVDLLIRQYATTYKPKDKTTATTLQHTALFGNTDDIRFQAFVAALMLLVGSVLLVACANVANMLLARGSLRHREIAIRVALGAGRGRVMRQLLTESLVLALLGGAGGLLASLWTTKLLWLSVAQLLGSAFGGNLVFQANLSPDSRVIAYAIAISALTGILFGLSPALQFSNPDVAASLKDEATSCGRRWSRPRLRNFLVVMQVTVCMILLISTGLLWRGLWQSQAADPGFPTRGLLLLFGDFGNNASKAAARQRRLADRFQTLPGVKNIALGSLPMMGTWTLPILTSEANGRTLASAGSNTYLATLGIPLLRGRNFTAGEAITGARVAVISESTARRFWPNEDALGKRFKLDLEYREHYTEFAVVGIAKDVRYANLSRLDPAHVYFPAGAQDVYGVLLRAQGDPQSAMVSVRSAVAALDPDLLPGLSLVSFEEGPLRLQKSLTQTYTLYAAVLALLALSLAGVGIYGVMSYLVSQRVPEIGVRMALGASAGDVLKAVVGQGLRPAFVGIALGMAGAVAISWTLHRTLVFPGSIDFFYGVPFYDPATFLGLSGFLIVVAGLATSVPARRALRVDPLVALRYE